MHNNMARLNNLLSDTHSIVPERFTVADITAICHAGFCQRYRLATAGGDGAIQPVVSDNSFASICTSQPA